MTDTAESRASTIPHPRTIVTADPELDDLNSMIRFLLYANELRIEGLVYASSRFHWRGDGRGTTFFLPEREYDRPQTSWRWAPGERFIDDAVDAYAEVHGNLVSTTRAIPRPRPFAPSSVRARSGETIHIIAEAVDDARRPLKSHRRVILTVR